VKLNKPPPFALVDDSTLTEHAVNQSTLVGSGSPVPAALSRHRGRDLRGGRLSPRRGGRAPQAAATAKRPRDAGRPCAAASDIHGEQQSSGTPIWCRRPQWLYLPNQGDELNDYAAKRRRAGLTVDNELEPGQPEQRQGAAQHVEAKNAERLGIHNHDGEDRVHEIRGQPHMPGAHVEVAGEVADAPIRARAGAAGERASGARGAAQQRLDARNAHLQQSLLDHAERVARRDACGRGPAPTPSAADRMVALRQRVAARLRESRPPPQDVVGVATCDDPRAPTIEVAKMHYYVGPNFTHYPAVEHAEAHVVSRSARSSASNGSDTANAATRAAQHGVAQPPDGDRRRLSG
jgi:hypothetical protein